MKANFLRGIGLFFVCLPFLAVGQSDLDTLAPYVLHYDGAQFPERIPEPERIRFFLARYESFEGIGLTTRDVAAMRAFSERAALLEEKFRSAEEARISESCGDIDSLRDDPSKVIDLIAELEYSQQSQDVTLVRDFHRVLSEVSSDARVKLREIVNEEVARTIQYTKFDFLSAATASPEIFAHQFVSNCAVGSSEVSQSALEGGTSGTGLPPEENVPAGGISIEEFDP